MPVDEDRGIAYDAEIVLRDTDWSLLIKRLLLYTSARIYRLGRARVFLQSNLEDYVQEAAKLILDGTRQFDPVERSLFQTLAGVVDSLVSHDLEKSVRRGVHLSLVQATSDDLELGEMLEGQLAAAESFESEILLREQCETFLASLHDDVELERYARLRAAGAWFTTEQYAEVLQTTIDNVRNMDRRLRRRRVNWSTRR